MMTRHIARTTELLVRYHRLVELHVVGGNDFLATAIIEHDTRVTPAKLIHPPERIQRQEKAVDRVPVTTENEPYI
jgi:hypothetical protein